MNDSRTTVDPPRPAPGRHRATARTGPAADAGPAANAGSADGGDTSDNTPPDGTGAHTPDDGAAGPPAGPPVAGGGGGTPPHGREQADEDRPGPTGAAVLAASALAWLAAMLWVAHATISSDVGVVALVTVASSLPSAVSAALVAGAAVGLLATSLPGGSAPGRRFVIAVGSGLLTGVAGGAAFVVGSGTDPARMALAGTLAAGATLGGALAAARPSRLVTAVVCAGLAVFAGGFLLSLVKAPIQDFYGAGQDEASQLSATGWYAATAALVSGLAAGLSAYRVLGGARRRPHLRWPVYLAAGAGPGILLLATELIVRTGGAKLLGLVREISDADRTLQAWAEGSRVNNALVILFVGAITALIGLGRTLPGPDRAEDR